MYIPANEPAKAAMRSSVCLPMTSAKVAEGTAMRREVAPCSPVVMPTEKWLFLRSSRMNAASGVDVTNDMDIESIVA